MKRLRVGGASLVAFVVGLVIAAVPVPALDIELTGNGLALKRGPLSFVANGFPEGDFLIVNEESGLALTTKAGAIGQGGSQSGYVFDPTVHMLRPDVSDRQRWFFDAGGENSRAGASNYLVNGVEEGTKGRFALGPGTPRDSLPGSNPPMEILLVGAGSTLGLRWQTEDGYLFEQGRPEFVLTYAPDREKLTMASRGASYQRWQLKAAK